MVSDGTGGLISMSQTLSFRDLLVSPMYSAVQLLARHFQCWIMSVFCASGIGSFGCMSKDLMVLVSLKKTLNSVFCWGVSVLFTETFDVWYGFLLGFALLKELCWVVVVL